MIFKPLIIISLVVALLILLVIAFGCSHRSKFYHAHFSPAKKAEWVTKRITRDINLNDQQKAKLDQIRIDFIRKHAELRPQQEEMFQSFINEIPRDTLNRELLKDMLEKKHQDVEQVYNFALDKMEEFHAVLTPGQRQKLAIKLTDFHNKMKH